MQHICGPMFQLNIDNFAGVVFEDRGNVKLNDWLPDRGAYPREWKGVDSTSQRILKIMISQLRWANFVNKTDYNYYQLYDVANEYVNRLVITQNKSDGRYMLRIPEDYFNIYQARGVFNQYPLVESDKYGAKDRVDKFVFLGEHLGDISVLPDFSRWCFKSDASKKDLGSYHGIYVYFENCGITNLYAFENNFKKLRSTGIFLAGNNVNMTQTEFNKFEKKAKQYDITIYSKPNLKADNTAVNTNTTKPTASTNITKPAANTQAGKVIDELDKKGGISGTSISTDNVKNAIKKKTGLSVNTIDSKTLTEVKTYYEQKNKAAAQGNKTDSSKNNNSNNTQEVQYITYTYTYTAHADYSADLSVNGREVTVKVNASGDKAPFVAVSPTDFDVYVDGEFKGRPGSDGILKFNANRVGEHVITIRKTFDGDGGDSVGTVNVEIEKPRVEVSQAHYTAIDKQGDKVNIKASSEIGIDSITYNGKVTKLNGVKSKNLEINAVSTIKKCEIVVRDIFGQETKIIKDIIVDTVKPKIKSFSIEKNGKNVDTKSVCRVKLGDKLKVTITANEAIKGIQRF